MAASRTQPPHRGRRDGPRAPWHPVPVAEICILSGIVGVAIGLLRGSERGGTVLAVGIAVAAVGVLESTIREHVTGYRSHTLILSLAPVVAVQAMLSLTVARGWNGVSVLIVDLALFGGLALVLQRWFFYTRAGKPNNKEPTSP